MEDKILKESKNKEIIKPNSKYVVRLRFAHKDNDKIESTVTELIMQAYSERKGYSLQQ